MKFFEIAEIEEIKPIRNSEKEIMVSIWCSTYNHGKYIRDALEGFVSQKTNFLYEIIIYDDASTDETTEIVKEYIQRYPEMFHVFFAKKNTYNHPKRWEIVYTFNKQFFTGKYVALCEGDDYWTNSSKLQTQIDFLEKNPNYSATVHNVCCIDEDGKFLHRDYELYPVLDEHIYGIQQIKKMQLAGQTASVVCKNIWKDMSVYEEEFYLEPNINGDVKINVILGLRNNIYCFKDIMAVHRRSFKGESWTARTVNKNLLWFLYNEHKIVRRFVSKTKGLSLSDKEELSSMLWRSKEEVVKNFNKENIYICMKFLKESFLLKLNLWKVLRKKTDISVYKNLSNKHLEIIRMYDIWMMANQEGHTIETYLKKRKIKSVVIYGMGYLGIRLFYELKNSSIEVLYGLDENSKIQIPEFEIRRLGEENKREVDAVIVTAFMLFVKIETNLKKNNYKNIIGIDEILYDLV